jgi:hypothetical protein
MTTALLLENVDTLLLEDGSSALNETTYTVYATPTFRTNVVPAGDRFNIVVDSLNTA